MHAFAILRLSALLSIFTPADLTAPLDVPQDIHYMNQKPPGTIPVLFAPEVFDFPEGYHSPVVFGPHGEAFFSLMSRELQTQTMNLIDGSWSPPRALDFGLDGGIGDPVLSPDGKRLYFLTFQAAPNDPGERERIWFAERIGDEGWSAPRLASPAIAAHPTHWTCSAASNYNLYFLSELGGGQDIYVSRCVNGIYREPQPLPAAVNTDAREFCPHVAPDESYLIFSRVGPETKKSDLYISFRKDDGSWAEAVPFGDEINSGGNEVAAVVTLDEKYLFFLSTRSGSSRMYWASAAVIDALHQQKVIND